MSENKTVKSFCSRCHYETNHGVLFSKTVDYDPEEYHCSSVYRVVQCLGCENISFRSVFYDFEASYPDNEGNWIPETTINLYPSLLKEHQPLSNTYILPSKIQTVYKEAINAFKANCFLLTGVAFRAVIEAVCIDKKIAGRDLETKINNLAKNRLITEKEADRLHSIRFIGNDSVHEMSVPKEESLYIVLDIIEHLLKNLYLIDYQAKGKIETVVAEWKEFIDLLNDDLKKYAVNDEFPLAKFLGKNIRRLTGRLPEFEKQLIKEINSGSYDNLTVGKFDKFGTSKDSLQHFIVTAEALKDTF